jgi:hypothetical protein
MEKLDGDLTDYIIKKSYLMAYKNLKEFDFYYKRLNFILSDYIDVKTVSQENQEKFKEIKKSVVKFIYEILLFLNSQLIFLYHKLLKKGWIYDDYKLDNIGYKKENEESEDIKLLFIDYDVSLYNIIQRAHKNKPDYTNYLNEHFVHVYIGDYYIFGEESLKRIFGMDFSNVYSEFNDKEEIISTLTEKNFEKLEEHIQFRWIQFKRMPDNIFFVIQFIMGLYRLVFFDDNFRHMSNPEFNERFNSLKIDELFFSKEGVYEKLDEIYH